MTTMADGSEPASLPQLYARARQLMSQVNNLQTSSEQYRTAVRTAIAAVQDCKRAVGRLALFSPNETLGDLTTSSLPYLNLDADLGDLLQKNYGGVGSGPGPDHGSQTSTTAADPSSGIPGSTRNGSALLDSLQNRPVQLRAAQDAYVEYLHLLDSYSLLSSSDRDLLARFAEDRQGFGLVPPGADPAARRGAKISRLNEEKALKARLTALEAKLEGKDNDDARGDDEDEVLRNLRLAELQLRVMHVFSALDMIAMELKVLATAPTEDERRAEADLRMRQQGKGTSKTNDDGYSEQLDGSRADLLRKGRAGPILDQRGRPLQPFTLLDKRAELQRGVFRPDHSLPTMSIDEYLAEERRRGGIIEGGGEPAPVEPNEDDMEAADRETIKQRNWDEFKEENPRGSGNTINRG